MKRASGSSVTNKNNAFERRETMTTLDISKARNELHKLADTVIKYDDVVRISSKKGNVVLMSEERYNSLLESLYLARIKGVYDAIEEAVNTPTEDFIKEIS